MPVVEIARRAGVSVRTVQRDAARLRKTKGRMKWIFHGVFVKADGKYHHQYPRAAALAYIAKRKQYRKGKLPKKAYESDWFNPLPAFPHKALLNWISCVSAYDNLLALTCLTHHQIKKIYDTLGAWSNLLSDGFTKFHHVRADSLMMKDSASKQEMEREEYANERSQMLFALSTKGLPKGKKLKPWVDY